MTRWTSDGVPLATWGQRFFAYLVDMLLLWLVGGLLLSRWNRIYFNELTGLLVSVGLTSAAMPSLPDLWNRGLVQMWLLNGIFHVLLCGSWDALCWRLWGATPGQMALGLRVVPRGWGRFRGRMPWLVAGRRALARRVLDGFVRPLWWISSFGVATQRCQDVPDMVAGTQVVRTR